MEKQRQLILTSEFIPQKVIRITQVNHVSDFLKLAQRLTPVSWKVYKIQKLKFKIFLQGAENLLGCNGSLFG